MEVPSFTLDAWIDRLGIAVEDIAFVKLDVQGPEMAVLRGAARMLHRRAVVFDGEVKSV